MTISYAAISDVRSYGVDSTLYPDAVVTDHLDIASRIIDSYTGAVIVTDGATIIPLLSGATAQTITIPDIRLPIVPLPRPFSSVTSVSVLGGGNIARVLDSSAYTIDQYGLRLYVPGFQDADGFPVRSYSQIGGLGDFLPRFTGPYGQQVIVSATFGYAAVPSPVRRACVLVTAHLLQMDGQQLLDSRIQRITVEGYWLVYDGKGADQNLITTGVPAADRMLQSYRTSLCQVA